MKQKLPVRKFYGCCCCPRFRLQPYYPRCTYYLLLPWECCSLIDIPFTNTPLQYKLENTLF